MNKDTVKLSSNIHLPHISSPKRKIDSSFNKVIYKKFFIPSVIEEIKIPPFEFKLNTEKQNFSYNEKLIAYKKSRNTPGGRINCVSVIPNRDSEYISRARLKKKLKISVEMPKINNFSKTPVQDIDLVLPLISKVNESPRSFERTKADAMINTDAL